MSNDDSLSEETKISRTLFSSTNFSPERFVDRVANTILFVPLTRLRAQSSGKQRAKQPDQADEEPLDFRNIAGTLVAEFEKYEKQLAALLAEEHNAYSVAESKCRSVEHTEKATLSKVRVRLDQTTGRLREFEDKLANAMASTVGIEQHLVQSNSRVQRGKSITLLLRHFESFTKISMAELHAALKGLSKGRAEQRVKKVQQWIDDGVSRTHPNYFGHGSGDPDGDDEGGRENTSDDDDEEPEEDDDEEDDGGNGGGGKSKKRRKPTHRAEAAAMAQGLDELFALRANVPVAANWILKLSPLSHELAQVVATASNIDVYMNWLMRELLEDMAFLVQEFRKYFDDNPKTAVMSPFGIALLRSVELVVKLSMTISPSGMEVVGKAFFADCGRRTCDDLRARCAVKPLPPAVKVPLTEVTTLSAMSHFINTNKRVVESALPYILERIKRELILVEAVFPSPVTARQQLWATLLDKVLHPYVTETLRESKEFEGQLTEQDAQLTPRSKRRCSDRVGDAIAYNLSLTTELYKFCTMTVDKLAEMHGKVEVDFLYGSFATIFDFRENYTNHHTEVELLKKLFRHLREKFTRAFAVPLEGPYLLREEHGRMAAEMFQHLESAVERIKTFSLPQSTSAYIVLVIATTIEEFRLFLEKELEKTIASLQGGMAQAYRPCTILVEYLHPKLVEAHTAAFQLLQFIQSQLLRLNSTCEKICLALAAASPGIFNEVEEIKIKNFQKIDEDAETAVFLACQLIVVRGLVILSNVQQKQDYFPSKGGGSRKAEASAAAASGIAGGATGRNTSAACDLFCRYMDQCLETALPFINLSCGELANAGQNANDGAFGFSGAAGTASPSSASHSPAAGAAATAVPPPNPHAAKVKSLSLRQLMFGDGSASVVRLIGVSLYRGILAHLRQFTVNDEGALMYKQDVSAFYHCMHPLTATDGFDGAVVDRLFLLMKETSNLYFMPLDNLKAVKSNGLLTLMSREELNTFVQMRFDVREARKLGVW